jgi:hypothetical protein
MPDIFVNYRHDDGHAAGRLKDRLEAEFSVFIDTDMEVGRDIDEVTFGALMEARIVIAIIGKEWVSARNLKRLLEPTDWIYRELERALSRTDATLIPVFVDDGVTMPEQSQLPLALQPFRLKKAQHLRYETWESDLAAFMSELRSLLKTRPPQRGAASAAPSDLPYLCDRVPQQQDFEDLVVRAKATRSLVCILHGHKYEAHAGFLTRLRQRRTLEQAFEAANTGVDVFPLEWNPREAREKRYEDLLRSAIKRNAMKTLAASPDDGLFEFLRNTGRPAIFVMQLSWEDLETHGHSLLEELARAWDALLARLAATPSQALLLWMNLSYENDTNELVDTSLPRLEKLSPVRERDIQEWLNLDEVRQRVEGRQSAFLNIANDSRYYIAPGKVHMLRFAEAAHELLNSRR